MAGMPDLNLSNEPTPRREVLRTIAKGAVGFTAFSYSRILGANDTVQLGVIGTGERGQSVMSVFQKHAKVRVAAVCDIWGTRLDQALSQAPGARGFNEHRKLLELSQLDAVL